MGAMDVLLRGLQAGAFTGPQAMEQLLGIRQQQRENAQARRQAIAQGQAETQQGLFSDLSSLALQGASEGTSLDSLIKQIGARQAFAGTALAPRYGQQLQQGLESLYLTNPESPNFGVSRISTALPPEAQSDIQAIVASEYQAGNTDPAAIESTVSRALGYGPKVMGRVSPEITTAVAEALKSVRGF